MFLGYSTQYAGDVYRFLQIKTNHIIHSQEVAMARQDVA